MNNRLDDERTQIVDTDTEVVPKSPNLTFRKKFRSSLLIFFIIFIVMGGSGVYYLLSEMRQLSENSVKELTSIADLKTTQISNWANERFEDAHQILDTPRMSLLANSYLHNVQPLQTRDFLVQWMKLYQRLDDYKQVSLVDSSGKIVLSVPDSAAQYNNKHQRYIEEVKKSGKIVVADLHLDVDSTAAEIEDISYSFWIPVKGEGAEANTVTGAWVIQVDPTVFLFPLVQSWPVPSKSAETLLVRRDGDDITFLNELRHKKNTAMKLKVKVSDNPNLPATFAVSGKEGIVEGRDYRGVKVIAVTRKVFGTPWYMVAKMDKSELYEHLWGSVWLTAILILVMMLTVAFVVGYLERKRDADWLRKQLVLELDKTKLQMDYKKIAREWQSTFDSISDVVWLLDAEGKILRSNIAAQSTLGKTDEELLGKDCWKALIGDDTEEGESPFAAMKLSKAHTNKEIKIDNKWLFVSIDPIFDDNNVLVGAVHIVRDITSRVEAEAAVKMSETRFRSIFDQSPMGISLVGFDKKFVKVNPGFCDLIGYSELELTAMTFADITHPDHIAQDTEKIEELIKGGINQYTTDKRYIRKDGRIIWAHVTVTLIKDSEGRPVNLLPIIEDITDKVAAEAAVKESEQMFRSMFANSIAGKSITLPDGSVTPNIAFCNMLGYTPEEMQLKWKDFTHPDDVAYTQEIVDSILAGERDSARFNKRYVHKNGSVIWADVSTVLQKDADNKPMYFINTILDITSSKLAEKEILKMNRVYAVISQINQMVVRTRDVSTILSESCQIAIEFGKFRMVWIGDVDEQTEKVVPIVHAGFEDGYLSEIEDITINDSPNGRGPTGTAVRTGKVVFCNDIATDPALTPWRDKALARGYRASIALPITVNGKLVKVFSLYAEEVNFFNETEIRLLEEVTGDISYALEMMEVEKTRRESELALKESEYRFRELFEHMSNGISVYEPIDNGQDFIIKDINPAGQRITKGNRDKIIGKRVTEVFPEVTEKGLLDVFREVCRTGVSKRCDTHNYRDNRLEYWLDNYVLRLDSGELIAFYDDITKEVIATTELRETNEYLQNLFDNANAPIIVWDPRFVIERFNHAFEHLTLYDAKEMVGKHLDVLFPPDASMDIMAKIRMASQGNNWESVEIPILRKDGQVRIALWNSSNVYDSEGQKVLGTIAQGQDITDRIEAEKRIQESEARLQQIIDSAPFGAHSFLLTDDDRLILTGANLSADRILGIDNQALIGKELLEAFPGNAGTGIPEIYRQVARGGSNFQEDQVMYDKGDISGAFEVHAMNIGKNRITVFFRDVTEKKKADAAIKKLNEELEQRVADRTALLEEANKELESFSYSVSHDLRSPLRGIDGWSQALEEDYLGKLDAQADDYLKRIRTETQRMNQLIEGLLKLAQIGKTSVVPETLNLSEIAEQVVARLREENPDREVNVIIEPDLKAKGDYNLIEIVLTNLLSNAWKFTAKKMDGTIELGSTNQNGKRVFFVRDNGAGFDMTFADKLFGAFQRLHKSTDFPGTGVGLATVKRIITRHGGSIWVESQVDKGTTFHFNLGE